MDPGIASALAALKSRRDALDVAIRAIEGLDGDAPPAPVVKPPRAPRAARKAPEPAAPARARIRAVEPAAEAPRRGGRKPKHDQAGLQEAYERGDPTLKIAADFGVSEEYVRGVARRKMWKRPADMMARIAARAA